MSLLNGYVISCLMSFLVLKHSVSDVTPVNNKDGVLSCVVRANVSVTEEEEESKDLQTSVHKIFIKVMPEAACPQRVFMESHGLDAIEVNTYKKLFSSLEQFEMERTNRHTTRIKRISPKFYAGDYDLSSDNRGFYIILQDLMPDFKMFSLGGDGLSIAQIVSSLNVLSYFHAITYAYGNVHNIDFTDGHKLPYESFLDNNVVCEFLLEQFKSASSDLGKHDKYAHLVPILDKMSLDYKTIFRESFDIDGRFLAHSDMWAHNLMFNNENECMIVDWQFCSASAPFLDFSAIAYMSADVAVTEANLEMFLDVYYDGFTATLTDLHISPQNIPWTKAEFQVAARNRGFFGLFVWLIFSYDPCIVLPNMLERFAWIFEKAILYSPQHFKNFIL